MLEIKNTTNGWAIEFDDVRVLTAMQKGLEERIKVSKYLLDKGHIDNIEDAKTEIEELEELLRQLH